MRCVAFLFKKKNGHLLTKLAPLDGSGPLPSVWLRDLWVGLAPTLVLGMAPTLTMFGYDSGVVPVSCLVGGLQGVGANPSPVWMDVLD